MKNRYSVCGFVSSLLLAFALTSSASSAAELLNLAPFAHLTTWNGAEEKAVADLAGASGASVGLVWDEERDIHEIVATYSGQPPSSVSVEYWFKNWPYDPPHMPSIEDPMDDPWQGQWLKADIRSSCDGQRCKYSFAPLSRSENPRADRMPGVAYRRTLKVRLVDEGLRGQLTSLRAFSDSRQTPVKIAIELGRDSQEGAPWSGWFSTYNGNIQSVTGRGFGASDQVLQDGHWSLQSAAGKALVLDIIRATPELPGSNDVTVITVHARQGHDGRTFSFAPADLEDGSIEIPSIGARIVDANKPSAARPRAGREKIRTRIPREPEQTYERASREIPPLDPWDREWAGPLYLPLAVDASWQKFAFQIGGDIYISKQGLKAKPEELKRLAWNGDRLTWRFGTGQQPYYREDHKTSLRPLNGCLPIAEQTWENEGLAYTEQAFATLLRGPLSPNDPGRSEHTPAVLMVRLTARNVNKDRRQAVVWLSTLPDEALELKGHALMSGNTVRAFIEAPEGAAISIGSEGAGRGKAQILFDVPANGESAIVVKLPAVTDLDANDKHDLESLRYADELEKVCNYWKKLTAGAARFSVPEARFNDLLRSTVAHIHITATKDPGTGLIMLPAASYIYDVYENESCYQLLLLDALGQSQTAADYLEPMLKLQGSKNFPGIHKGPADGIFHGVKISGADDYTANGYGLDQGTVLWTLAQHYLYTRDGKWFAAAWPHMQKAIRWIIDQRSTTKRNDVNGQPLREYGLLPASQLEDNVDWANWFSINAFAWAGMDLTAQALADTGRPEAEEVRREADAYRADLRNAVLRATQSSPVVRMQDGTYEPYVPTVPTRRFRLFGPAQMNYYQRYQGSTLKPLLRLGADRDTLCGTVLLVILGVFSPDEPITDWILNDWEDNETLSSGMGMNVHGMTDDRYWFSQGGMVFQANLINPIPIYLKRHEVPAAIRNLYNDYIACLYPEVNAFTEEYHQWRHASGPFYKSPDEARFVNRLRDTLVLEDRDTLWLAPGAPRRWLTSPEGINVSEAQTFFGPVSYRMHASPVPNRIEATVTLPTRNAAKMNWLVVRTPTGHIRSVTIYGQTWTKINPDLEAIELPATRGTLNLQIEY